MKMKIKMKVKMKMELKMKMKMVKIQTKMRFSITMKIRKREIRLLKNREAARECRRKKKEYIKCLENRFLDFIQFLIENRSQS